VLDVTYEQAMTQLVELARANGGVVLSAHVEADDALSEAQSLVCAAARALAGSTNVFSLDEPDRREWFPYSKLIFSELSKKKESG
jgi:hypothetical protein